MASVNPNFWNERKVLLTGHTGFKGSWLGQVLELLGAKVTGYSFAPNTQPSHFDLLKWKGKSVIGDIRDDQKMGDVFEAERPEIVFHLAAQPLVIKSYQDPKETYETNVMGTLNVLECVRKTKSVKAVIVVTSDKCYENREVNTAYLETDAMGGYDPYSSSKGCAELLTASYRRSFFNPEKFGQDHGTLVASVRAGNVLGGGDWAENRLLPDFARAYAKREAVKIRRPNSVRPWQHVLDPLNGYMLLAERLYNGDVQFADGWNFGPDKSNFWTVGQILEHARAHWPGFKFESEKSDFHEANLLMLNSEKAEKLLEWRPRLSVEQTLDWTLDWYESFINNKEIVTAKQITKFLEK